MAPQKPMYWEGEEIPPDTKGPAYGKPMPRLEDRFPAEDVAKLRQKQREEKVENVGH